MTFAAASTAADLLQHLLDTVLGFRADLGPGIRLKVQVALQDGVKNLLLALSPEGWHSTQQDVQDDSTAPNVCLMAVVPPQHLKCTHKEVTHTPTCGGVALSLSAGNANGSNQWLCGHRQ